MERSRNLLLLALKLLRRRKEKRGSVKSENKTAMVTEITDGSELRLLRIQVESVTSTTSEDEIENDETKIERTTNPVGIKDLDTKTGKMTTDEIETGIGIETDEAAQIDQNAETDRGKPRRLGEHQGNPHRHIYGTYYELTGRFDCYAHSDI